MQYEDALKWMYFWMVGIGMDITEASISGLHRQLEYDAEMKFESLPETHIPTMPRPSDLNY